MKQTICVTTTKLAAVLLLAFAGYGSALAAPQLQVLTKTVWPTLPERLPVNFVADTANPISAVQFELSFNSQITASLPMLEGNSATHQLVATVQGANVIRVTITPTTKNAALTNTTLVGGTLLFIPVDLKATADFANKTVSIQNIVFGNVTAGLVSGTATSGWVKRQADNDADGLSDEWEVKYFGNTTTSSGRLSDWDGDRVTDVDEFLLKRTHPKLMDTDGDGVNDLLDGAPNDPTSSATPLVPTANNGSITVATNTTYSGTLSATNAASYAITSNPTNGSVFIDNALTGHYVYLPNANASGADSFTFKAIGATGLASNIAAISITIKNDSDGDSVFDDVDNCSQIANSHQLNTDNDRYGDLCDPDLDNDGWVTFGDVARFRLDRRNPSYIQNADFNSDGFVDDQDQTLLKKYLFGPPGPGATTRP